MPPVEGAYTYRIISRLEIPMPERTGVKGPILQISWDFPGHAPRLIWIPKAEWTKELEDKTIRAELQRIAARTGQEVK
jgi:hypothetical protein